MRLRNIFVLTVLVATLCGCELVTEDFKKVKSFDTCSGSECGADTTSTPVDTSDTADTVTVDTSDTATVDTADTATGDTADTATVDTSDTATVDTEDTATVDTEDTATVDTADTADTADSDTADSELDTDALCVAAQCDSNAVCVIESDSAYCACIDGYQMEGTDCVDIDECSSTNGGCAQTCVNTSSSFYCECDEHYTLAQDGFSCLPICNDFHVGLTDAIGGAISDVAVAGNFVYALAGGNGVYVFDVSDGTPVLVGISDILHDGRRLLIEGDILLVADGDWGLTILDVAEPSTPVVISQTGSRGEAIDVAVIGNFAYVLNDGGWVAGIDIAPPTSPKLLEISHLGLGDEYRYATALVSYGNKLVVSEANIRMAMLSVGADGGVWESDTFSNTGALDMHISGDRLYAAANLTGVLIYDLTAPATPPVEISGAGNSQSVWGNNSVLVTYANFNPKAVTAFNVADLEAITEIASLPWNDSVAAIAGDSSNVYLADGTYGLQTIATDSLATVPLVAGYPMPGNSTQLAVKGNYAFVVDGVSGVKTVDLENPHAAAPVVPQTEGANAIAIGGDYLYVAKGDGTIMVDVSDPVQASVVTSDSSNGTKIAVAGDYVYVGWGAPRQPGGIKVLKRDGDSLTYLSQMSISNLGSIKTYNENRLYYTTMSGFVALDITDPSSINTIDTVVLAGEIPAGVVFAGQYAFVGRSTSSDSFISVISLEDMNEITSIPVGNLKKVLYADNNHLIYTDVVSDTGSSVVYARDISDLSNPGPAMMLALGKDNMVTNITASDFAVWNSTALIAKGAEGLKTLDFPFDYHPSIASWQPAERYINDMITGNNMLYVADADGLQIYRPELDGTLSEAAFWGSTAGLEKIWLQGTTLFATSTANDLRIYDVTDPTVESVPTVFDQDTRYTGVTGRSDILYVATQNDGLRTLDITAPLAPVSKGSAGLTDASFAKDIALNGTTAYILDDGYSSRGLRLFDIANPDAPELLLSSNTQIVASTVHRVTVVNNIVYVASGVAGINILRQNGTLMEPLGVLDGIGDVRDLAAFDGKMAVASRSGLYVLDLTVPESPDVLCHIPVSTTLVAVDDNYLYAARQSDGISVIDLFSCQEMQ